MTKSRDCNMIMRIKESAIESGVFVGCCQLVGRLFLLMITLFLVVSCSITRHIPDGKFMLKGNKIEIERDHDLQKNEYILSSDLEKFIGQKPTKRYLGFNIPLWLYASSNPNKDNAWNRFKKRMGEPPVLLDTTSAAASANAMKLYMDSRGFLSAESSNNFVLDSVRRRAEVVYKIHQGQPYRIGTIGYDIKDKFIEPIIMQDSSKTLLKTGYIFDVTLLANERTRISNYLKNKGYYNFSINNISYIADSTAGNRTVNLTMVVKQYLAGYNAEGEAIMDNNKIYRIRNVNVFPNYNPTLVASDSLLSKYLDTTFYKGLNIVSDSILTIRPEILRQTVTLYPNSLYSLQDLNRTYDNIMRLGYYRSANILFSEVVDTIGQNNFITFIGDGKTESDVNYTQESYIDCNILCTPALRQSYTIEFEGTTSSDYFGIMAKVGYQNRNLFKGVELFDVSLRGGYEFMRSKSKRNSFDFGGSVSFTFPRFITPIDIDPYNKLFNPTTRVEVLYNVQRRPYYHRALSSAVWSYAWGNNRNSSFVLRPIDVSFIKLLDVDQSYLDSLKNPYLRNSYISQFIAGISGSYVFNNERKVTLRRATTLRINMETNGNLINGLSALLGHKNKGEDFYRLFGVRYSQYARMDLNFAKSFPVGEKSSLVYRFYTGWGYAYGNSMSISIPFERLFYSGGSNSMRGWLARTLGPGSETLPIDAVFPSQLGNFKLETNLEARFPVWGIVQGALFFDLGNIWFVRQGEYNPEGTFHFNTFAKQLGFNTGVGVRLNLGITIIRADWGVKLHNPNEPLGNRWIKGFDIKNTTLNFGVGYPF